MNSPAPCGSDPPAEMVGLCQSSVGFESSQAYTAPYSELMVELFAVNRKIVTVLVVQAVNLCPTN